MAVPMALRRMPAALTFVVALVPCVAAGGAPASDVERLGESCRAGTESACQELLRIARGDAPSDVRQSAVGQISDQALLVEIAESAGDDLVRLAAAERLEDQARAQAVVREVVRSDDLSVRLRAASLLADQALGQRIILQIARSHPSKERRLEALSYLTDAAALQDLARRADKRDFRVAALERLLELHPDARLKGQDPKDLVLLIERGVISGEETLLQLFADHEDPALRRAIAKRLDPSLSDTDDPAVVVVRRIEDPGLLARLATEDSSAPVRAAAIERVDDRDLLVRIVTSSADWTLRLAAAQRIEDPDLLARLATRDTNGPVRLVAVKRVDDQAVLARVALDDAHAPVRLAAVERVTDAGVLARLATSDKESRVRVAATKRIEDQKTLQQVATRDPAPEVRAVAVEKVESPEVLSRIAAEDPQARIRLAAAARLQTRAHGAAREASAEVASLERLVREADDSAERYSAKARLLGLDAYADALGRDTQSAVDLIAAGQVTDRSVLLRILFWHEDEAVQRAVATQLDAGLAKQPDLRLAFLPQVDDPSMLEALATTDPDPLVRLEAIKRVSDQALVERAATTDPSSAVRVGATRRVANQALLEHVATTARLSSLRAAAVKRLTDQALLERIATQDPDPGVRAAAAERVDDPDGLKRIAATDGEASVRVAAASKVGDPDWLRAFVAGLSDARLRERFVRGLGDQPLLAEIATSDREPAVRMAATEALEDRSLLLRVLYCDTDAGVQLAAARRLQPTVPSVEQARNVLLGEVQDPDVLRCLTTGSSSAVRLADALRSNDQQGLFRLVMAAPETDARVAALGSIDDPALLTRIAMDSGAVLNLRAIAVRRLTDIDVLRAIATRDASEGLRDIARRRIAALAAGSSIAGSTADRAAAANAEKRLAAGAAAAVRRLRQQERARLMAVALGHDEEGRIEAATQLAAMPGPDPSSGEPWEVDQAALADVVAKTPDPAVRARLLPLIAAPGVLLSLALQAERPETALAAVERVSDPDSLVRVVKTATLVESRVSAVGRLTDQGTLTAIALSENHLAVRAAAVAALTDQGALVSIADSRGAPTVRAAAVGKIQDASIVRRLALGDPEWQVRRAAVAALDDQELLAAVGQKDVRPEVRFAASSRVSDPTFLAVLARGAADPAVRRLALGRLDDPVVLAERVRDDEDPTVRLLAVRQIKEVAVLERVARNDPDRSVREAAKQERERRVRLARSALRQARAAEAVRNASSSEEALAALRRVSDPALLQEIAATDPRPEIRRAAQQRLDDRRSPAPVDESAREEPLREAAQPTVSASGEQPIRAAALREVEPSAAEALKERYPRLALTGGLVAGSWPSGFTDSLSGGGTDRGDYNYYTLTWNARATAEYGFAQGPSGIELDAEYWVSPRLGFDLGIQLVSRATAVDVFRTVSWDRTDELYNPGHTDHGSDAAAGELADLRRRDVGLHAAFTRRLRLTPAVDLDLSIGPALVMVSQQFLSYGTNYFDRVYLEDGGGTAIGMLIRPALSIRLSERADLVCRLHYVIARGLVGEGSGRAEPTDEPELDVRWYFVGFAPAAEPRLPTGGLKLVVGLRYTFK